MPVLTPRVDIANVRLRFANGCIANLTASRISRDRVRKIRFFQREPTCRSTTRRRKSRCGGWCRSRAGMPEIEGGKLDGAREEPLKRELEDFVAAVRDGRAPVVTGEQGRAALALAERIVELMRHVNINLAIAERARAGEALTVAEIDELGASDICRSACSPTKCAGARVGDIGHVTCACSSSRRGCRCTRCQMPAAPKCEFTPLPATLDETEGADRGRACSPGRSC